MAINNHSITKTMHQPRVTVSKIKRTLPLKKRARRFDRILLEASAIFAKQPFMVEGVENHVTHSVNFLGSLTEGVQRRTSGLDLIKTPSGTTITHSSQQVQAAQVLAGNNTMMISSSLYGTAIIHFSQQAIKQAAQVLAINNTMTIS